MADIDQFTGNPQIDKLLSTIRAKQPAKNQQFRDEMAEEERRRRIGTIRQGSFYDDNIAPFVNMIKPYHFSNEPNVDPETGVAIKDFGHFLTSGIMNTAANTLSTADALSTLLLGGAGTKFGKKFLTGLGERGAYDRNSINKIMQRITKRQDLDSNVETGAGDLEKFTDEEVLKAKLDMVKLVDFYSSPKMRKEALQSLTPNKKLSNYAFNQMSEDDKNLVRRQLKKLGYKK